MADNRKFLAEVYAELRTAGFPRKGRGRMEDLTAACWKAGVPVWIVCEVTA